VLPESLPPERRMAFEWKRANPVGSLNLLRSQRQLLGLATIDFIDSLAHQVLPSVFVLYAAYRYGWGETMVGLTLAFVGICSALVQGLVVGPAVTQLGTRHALIAGLLAGSLGMMIYALAPTGSWFWLGVPVMALWGVAGPSLQDMMSRRVSPSEQGQLQGANSSSRSVAGMIGPGVFTATFAYLINWLPGAAFLLAASLLIGAAGVAWVVTAPSRADDRFA
jgi:DHA1 family tetracycline resistance protein-like MFS transporter